MERGNLNRHYIMTTDYFRLLRDVEFDHLIKVLPKARPCRLLEVGAGAGWQARRFHDLGFEVAAVDVPGSAYESSRVWDVRLYDGMTLPFEGSSFDIVFTSHVLERIVDLERFDAEIRRVLKPEGKAIHVLPSAGFGVWNIFLHYPFVFKLALQFFRGRSSTAAFQTYAERARTRSFLKNVRGVVFPYVLSVRGNAATQAYFFSRRYWIRFFRGNDWIVEDVSPGGVFCSGNSLFGLTLDAAARKVLAAIFGSSSTVYSLKRGGA